MTRVIMHGCNGRMGIVITNLAKDMADLEIVAGVDMEDKGIHSYPVFTSLEAVDVEADVIVDFANAKAEDHLLDFCAEKKMPVVVCTTGLSEAQIAKVSETAEKTAVLRSANMSLGVNTLMKLIADAAKVLAPAGFDMEIVEKHHNQKLDAPSGTAIALGESLNEAMNGEYHFKFDRTAERAKRDPKEIGFAAVRGGTIVGEHDVIFAGTDEVVTISHTAYSRAIFGKGALAAAAFLAGKEKGLYTMADVISASSN